MRKILYIFICILLTIVVCILVVSIPEIIYGSKKWLNGWVDSEKYLLIENGIILTQKVFPRFGIVQVFMFLLFTIIGFILSVIYFIRVVKTISNRLPKYKDHKNLILQISAVVLLSIIMGVFIGYGELCVRVHDNNSPIVLLGYKLTSPSSAPEDWKQQHAADERGMEYLLPDGVQGDTLQHLNKQGFLSLFNYTKEYIDSLRKTGKIIVFVFGDSFVQGCQSTTWDKSFCELSRVELSSKYAIFNFGMAGTDPLDYKLRAEKFIPSLKPDMTVICFCGYNDIMYYDRIPSPYTPLWINTPVGPVCSNLYNKILLPDADSLYNYFTSNVASKRVRNGLVRWVCEKSYLVSLAYDLLNPWLPQRYGSADTCEASYRNLKVIKELCLNDSIPFRIAFIPDNQNLQKTEESYRIAYGNVFKDLLTDTDFPLGFIDEDFPKKDIHFNDKGNRKFANFLEQEIIMQNESRIKE